MSRLIPSLPWAHPRSRGENDLIRKKGTTIWGSSPLTRGKPFALALAGLRPGLIPAHAGKTLCVGPCGTSTRAHPRSRGENDQGAPDHGWPVGSSPLTRGKRSGRARSRLAGRLIPAHAGKTHCSVLSVCRGAAHPRSRGENGARGGVRFGGGGSSPLTRGKLVGTRHVGPSTGLIPAHAGKTSYRRVGLRSFRAHPRSRGENRPSSSVSRT